jgi:hypothetical protein
MIRVILSTIQPIREFKQTLLINCSANITDTDIHELFAQYFSHILDHPNYDIATAIFWVDYSRLIYTQYLTTSDLWEIFHQAMTILLMETESILREMNLFGNNFQFFLECMLRDECVLAYIPF